MKERTIVHNWKARPGLTKSIGGNVSDCGAQQAIGASTKGYRYQQLPLGIIGRRVIVRSAMAKNVGLVFL